MINNKKENKDMQIIDVMVEWAKSMGVNDCFMPFNACVLDDIEKDIDKRSNIFMNLVNKGILEVRKCDGYAFDFTDKYKNKLVKQGII